MKRSRLIANSLRYRIPRLKLCLVHDGKASDLYMINSPSEAAELVAPLKQASEEHFLSVHLNSHHEVIGVHEVSHGTLASSLVHPREVFKAAIVNNSYALIVCHNHPSGSRVSPSLEDIDTTKKLIAAGQLLGISVLDHLILSPNQPAYSLREHNPDLWKH